MSRHEQERRWSPTYRVERLTGGNETTLYGEKPSRLALRVRQKLNHLAQKGLHIEDVIALPDYHTFGTDGGIKDILFVTKPSTNDSAKTEWGTRLVLPSDSHTLRGRSTPDISETLRQTLEEVKTEGFEPVHVIAITDHSNITLLQGIGGLDGLKNFIVCYKKPQ